MKVSLAQAHLAEVAAAATKSLQSCLTLLGVRDGQGGLAGCDSWGCKESDTTEHLNYELWQFYFQFFKESPHCSP